MFWKKKSIENEKKKKTHINRFMRTKRGALIDDEDEEEENIVNKKFSLNLFSRKNKQEDTIYNEDEYEDFIEEKKMSFKMTTTEKYIIITLLSTIFIVVSTMLFGFYLYTKVDNVNITLGTKVDLEKYKELKPSNKNNINSNSTEKSVDYFLGVSQARNSHYANNEADIDDSIERIEKEEEEKEKLEQEEENKKEEDKTPTINAPKLPKNEKLQTTITTLNKLLKTTLENSSKNYGGVSTIELSSDKTDKLNKILVAKGTSYTESKLYTLDTKLFPEKISDYELKDFAVITEGSLKGEVVYIGNNVSGLKDDDGSYWFGYNLYATE